MGAIAMIFIQRALFKIIVAVFLSREFRHDETNRAWWTGRWYGRGLGSSACASRSGYCALTWAVSQPLREFVVKLVEMNLFAADFITVSLLLMVRDAPRATPLTLAGPGGAPVDPIHRPTSLDGYLRACCAQAIVLTLQWLAPSRYGTVACRRR